VADVAGVAQLPVRVEEPAADRRPAVGEDHQVGGFGAPVGEVQQRAPAVFGQAGHAGAGVQHAVRDPGGQCGGELGPGGEPARVGPADRVAEGPAVDRRLPDRLRGDVDVLALVDADAVEDVEAGVLQRDQAAAEGGAGGHGLIEGDVFEAGLGEQQGRGGTGQGPADDGDPGSVRRAPGAVVAEWGVGAVLLVWAAHGQGSSYGCWGTRARPIGRARACEVAQMGPGVGR
jgi:hypothetical protein